jgi:hypothetical protein
MSKYKEWRQLSFTKEDQCFNWGYEKGKTIVEVMKTNSQYIDWCLSNVKKFKLGVKIQKIWDDLQYPTKSE